MEYSASTAGGSDLIPGEGRSHRSGSTEKKRGVCRKTEFRTGKGILESYTHGKLQEKASVQCTTKKYKVCFCVWRRKTDGIT